MKFIRLQCKAESERIQSEILEILRAEGYDVERPVKGLLKELSEEPRFLYPETDEGREQVLEDYRKIIAEISTGLDDWFSGSTKAGVEVERIPGSGEDFTRGLLQCAGDGWLSSWHLLRQPLRP